MVELDAEPTHPVIAQPLDLPSLPQAAKRAKLIYFFLFISQPLFTL
jgi:hypothetical protein